MDTIKRLLVVLIIVLFVEGAAGTAVAGLTIEAEMDPWTAGLLVAVVMLGSGGITLVMLLWVVTRGKGCKSPIVRAIARMFVAREQEDILERLQPMIDYCAVRIARDNDDVNIFK